MCVHHVREIKRKEHNWQFLKHLKGKYWSLENNQIHVVKFLVHECYADGGQVFIRPRYVV